MTDCTHNWRGASCPYCEVDMDDRLRSRNARISANQAPVYPIGSLTIQVVESGARIHHRGETLTVDDNTAVVRDACAFVTQATWQMLIERSEVRVV